MKICVIGQGYIGLPTALLFAKNGCDVVGVDINEKIISNLNKGIIPIEEPGLDEIFKECLKNKKYHASLTPEEADVFIITVPTPFKEEDLSCDLSFVVSGCNSIINKIKKNNIVIVESTIAPLSMKNVIKPIFEDAGYEIGNDLFLAHCPERVLPGNMVNELISNNRIVGGVTKNCAQKTAEVYKIFVKGNVIETKSEIAEMSKCMENTFRDVNIALANELVKVGSELGIDALKVIEIANQHPRVNIHSPGPGVGGHCLAIDPYFIYTLASEEAKIIKLSRDTNKSMPSFVVKQTNNIMKNEENKIISIFGVAYKGNSDDDRESPAYEIISELEKDYELKIYDPHMDNQKLTFDEAILDSSLILVLCDHKEFKHIDFNKLNEKMRNPVIFDTKNIVEKQEGYENIKIFNFGNIYEIS